LKVEISTAVLLDPSSPEVGAELLLAISNNAGFRPGALERMPADRAARQVLRVPSFRVPLPFEMASIFLQAQRREMLAAFLDEVNVAHEDGIFEDLDAVDIAPERARAASATLLETFPPEEVLLYLLTLDHLNQALVPEGRSWIPQLAAGTLDRDGDGPGPVATIDVERSADSEPEFLEEALAEDGEQVPALEIPFTALDRTLIRAAVDAAQGVRGALDFEKVEDMVEEVIELNSSRHQSFFHRGFVDALTDLTYRAKLRSENQDRRLWYSAGWCSGKARLGKHEDIVKCFDEELLAGDALSGRTPQVRLLLPLILPALAVMNRVSEMARLLTPPQFLDNPALVVGLSAEATRLLRADEAEAARPILDRLAEAIEVMEGLGADPGDRFFLEIRRRRAHCYRQLGDALKARELLEALLADDGTPEIQAMVHADLGLLDSGFRGLGQVELWKSEAEKSELRAALKKGAPRFQASLDLGNTYSSHGAWPLALLALSEENWKVARDLLSLTLSSFLERPQRYLHEGLLARVHLASGVAEAMNMEYTRLPRAKELLLRGMEDGARLPAPLAVPVLEALDCHEGPLLEGILPEIVKMGESELLDELASTALAGRSPVVARALLDRSRVQSRPKESRAADIRRAIPLLLSQQVADCVEEARAGLDTLELLAVEGFGRDEFLAFLSDAERVSSAWSRDDVGWARIRILEMEERFDESVAELQQRLSTLLHDPGPMTAIGAADLVTRARSYGIEEERFGALSARVEAWTKEYGAEDAEVLPARHPNQLYRILIVGGDERQQNLKGRVKALLREANDPIRIEHLPTGWSGNWSKTLEDALRAASSSDAVVLLSLIRTEFGRSFRAGVSCPWIGCSSVGPTQVANRVRMAASFAATRSAAVD
jgi:hypothetical protein